MSYILEALKKMEAQRKGDNLPESWVDNLTVTPPKEKAGIINGSRLIVAVSILFGVCGISIGLLLFYTGQAPNKSLPVANPVVPQSTKKTIRADTPPSPVISPKYQTATTSETSSKDMALSTSGLLIPERPLKKDGGAGKLPAMTKSFDNIRQLSEKEISNDNKKHGGIKKAAAVSTDLPVTSRPSPPELINLELIDLTNQYKLSSTGDTNGRKYATIEKNSYHIGDAFNGMIITGIKKDRVNLKGENDVRNYVIIFRYKK